MRAMPRIGEARKLPSSLANLGSAGRDTRRFYGVCLPDIVRRAGADEVWSGLAHWLVQLLPLLQTKRSLFVVGWPQR